MMTLHPLETFLHEDTALFRMCAALGEWESSLIGVSLEFEATREVIYASHAIPAGSCENRSP